MFRYVFLLVACALVAANAACPDHNATKLTPDTPYYNTVDRFYFEYYCIDIAADQMNYAGFTLKQSGKGACHLYEKFNQLPTIKSYDARNNTVGSTIKDILVVNPKPGTYFIGVYGFEDCSFSLVGGSQGVPTMHEGRVETGAVTYFKYTYYQFFVPPTVVMLEIMDQRLTAGSSIGSDADMYLGLEKVPSKTSSTAKNTSSYKESCIKIVNPTEGKYYYGQYGYKGTTNYRTVFRMNGDGSCQFDWPADNKKALLGSPQPIMVQLKE